jgi:hypothetical protein
MNLGTYISELLFNHDCVVVEGFGGFVCQEFNAHINEATQMFVPPAKKVSFQSALSETNLLLERYIAKQQNVSFETAKQIIASEVAGWKEELKQGNHIKLDDVGRIYFDNERKVSFQSDINANFNSDSFGLGIFRFPVLREEATSPVRDAVVAATAGTKRISTVWQKAAMVAAVVGLFYIGSQKADFNSFDIASFNPFKSSKTVELPIEKASALDEVVLEEEFTSSLGSIDTEVKELPELLEVNTAKPYHIIVGAFKVQENASAYLQQLRNSGLENAQYFHEKGFYRVSAEKFATRNEAVTSLSDIKRKIQKGAWIYRK